MLAEEAYVGGRCVKQGALNECFAKSYVRQQEWHEYAPILLLSPAAPTKVESFCDTRQNGLAGTESRLCYSISDNQRIHP